MFCNFLLQMNMAKRRHVSLTLLILKPADRREETNKLTKRKFALTCSFQKMIRALAFSAKFGNSCYFIILGIV